MTSSQMLGGATPFLLELRRALSPEESKDGLGQLVLEKVPGGNFLGVYSQSGGVSIYAPKDNPTEAPHAERRFLGLLAQASGAGARLFVATAAPAVHSVGITGYALGLEDENLVFAGLGEADLAEHPFRLLPGHHPLFRPGGDHISAAFLSPGLCAQVAFESGLVPFFEDLEGTAPLCRTSTVVVAWQGLEDQAVGLMADPAGVCWFSPGEPGFPALRLTSLMGRAWLARSIARMAGQGGGSLWDPGSLPEGMEVRVVGQKVHHRYRLAGNATGLSWEALPAGSHSSP